jgi:cytochrome c-type biogenesis protein CcmH/NrfG
LSWCRKATALNPQEPKYAYTLAFYQKEQKDLKGAAATLKDLLAQRTAFVDGHILLAEIYVQQGERPQAEMLLRQLLQKESLSPRDRTRIVAALQSLITSRPSEDNRPGKR